MNFRWSTRMPDETAGPALYQAEMPNSPGMPIWSEAGHSGNKFARLTILLTFTKKPGVP